MRIEIDIRDNISPEIALECVQYVIEKGKISHDNKNNAYYCWATTFKTKEGTVCVFTRPYRKANGFKVYKIQQV